MHNIYQAIHDTTTAYSGGMRQLAKDLGLQPGTFSNKCNPSVETHILNIKELVEICKQTENLTPLHEIARELHCVCVPIEEYDGVADMQLLDAWSDWDIERAETKKEIKEALDRHQITKQCLERIEREMFEDFRKELALLERLRLMAV